MPQNISIFENRRLKEEFEDRYQRGN